LSTPAENFKPLFAGCAGLTFLSCLVDVEALPSSVSQLAQLQHLAVSISFTDFDDTLVQLDSFPALRSLSGCKLRVEASKPPQQLTSISLDIGHLGGCSCGMPALEELEVIAEDSERLDLAWWPRLRVLVFDDANIVVSSPPLYLTSMQLIATSSKPFTDYGLLPALAELSVANCRAPLQVPSSLTKLYCNCDGFPLPGDASLPGLKSVTLYCYPDTTLPKVCCILETAAVAIYVLLSIRGCCRGIIHSTLL